MFNVSHFLHSPGICVAVVVGSLSKMTHPDVSILIDGGYSVTTRLWVAINTE